MPTIGEFLGVVPERIWVVLGVLALGIVLGYLVGIVNRRILIRAGVPEAVEGTAFERTARGFGTSTVAIVAKLSTYFVIGLTVLAAVSMVNVQYITQFWNGIANFIPRLFTALLVLIIGIVVSDKVELVISERLRGVKLPQVGYLPTAARYSVVYIAVLMALGELGIATAALVVLLGGYLFALVLLGGFAFKDMLASGAAGIYLLLNQPYGIGDEIRVGDRRGIVQEMDVFVTRVESDGEEYIIPNGQVFREGVIRFRS